jgi:hypothetical protein
VQERRCIEVSKQPTARLLHMELWVELLVIRLLH